MSHYNFGCKVPPQRRWPVAWYNPAVLLRSARDLLSTADQIRNFDRRELFAGAMDPVIVSARDAHSDFLVGFRVRFGGWRQCDLYRGRAPCSRPV